MEEINEFKKRIIPKKIKNKKINLLKIFLILYIKLIIKIIF